MTAADIGNLKQSLSKLLINRKSMHNKRQDLQEAEYKFPYHYISSFKPAFKHSFTDTWGINYVSTVEYLLGRLDQLEFSSIVDVGCGDGRFSRELSERFRNKFVLGIDYSYRAIDLARAINRDMDNLRFIAYDIRNSWDGKKHDIAILMEVFEHIPTRDEEAFISGLHELLRKGGILLLTVPHTNKPVEYKHFRHFSSYTIAESLKNLFEITEIVPFEKVTPIRRIVYFLLANQFFVLNNQRLLNWIYKYYRNNLFFCEKENKCQRIFLKAIAK